MRYTAIGKVLYARFESESQRLRKNKIIQSNIHIFLEATRYFFRKE